MLRTDLRAAAIACTAERTLAMAGRERDREREREPVRKENYEVKFGAVYIALPMLPFELLRILTLSMKCVATQNELAMLWPCL